MAATLPKGSCPTLRPMSQSSLPLLSRGTLNTSAKRGSPALLHGSVHGHTWLGTLHGPASTRPNQRALYNAATCS